MRSSEWIRITEGEYSQFTTFVHIGERVYLLYIDGQDDTSPGTTLYRATFRRALPERNDLAADWSDPVWFERRGTPEAAIAASAESALRECFLGRVDRNYAMMTDTVFAQRGRNYTQDVMTRVFSQNMSQATEAERYVDDARLAVREANARADEAQEHMAQLRTQLIELREEVARVTGLTADRNIPAGRNRPYEGMRSQTALQREAERAYAETMLTNEPARFNPELAARIERMRPRAERTLRDTRSGINYTIEEDGNITTVSPDEALVESRNAPTSPPAGFTEPRRPIPYRWWNEHAQHSGSIFSNFLRANQNEFPTAHRNHFLVNHDMAGRHFVSHYAREWSSYASNELVDEYQRIETYERTVLEATQQRHLREQHIAQAPTNPPPVRITPPTDWNARTFGNDGVIGRRASEPEWGYFYEFRTGRRFTVHNDALAVYNETDDDNRR